MAAEYISGLYWYRPPGPHCHVTTSHGCVFILAINTESLSICYSLLLGTIRRIGTIRCSLTVLETPVAQETPAAWIMACSGRSLISVAGKVASSITDYLKKHGISPSPRFSGEWVCDSWYKWDMVKKQLNNAWVWIKDGKGVILKI